MAASILARQETGATRRTQGRRHESVGKSCAFLAQTVQMRRPKAGVIHQTQGIPALVVGKNKQKIRPLWERFLREADQGGRQNCMSRKCEHGSTRSKISPGSISGWKRHVDIGHWLSIFSKAASLRTESDGGRWPGLRQSQTEVRSGSNSGGRMPVCSTG